MRRIELYLITILISLSIYVFANPLPTSLERSNSTLTSRGPVIPPAGFYWCTTPNFVGGRCNYEKLNIVNDGMNTDITGKKTQTTGCLTFNNGEGFGSIGPDQYTMLEVFRNDGCRENPVQFLGPIVGGPISKPGRLLWPGQKDVRAQMGDLKQLWYRIYLLQNPTTGPILDPKSGATMASTL